MIVAQSLVDGTISLPSPPAIALRILNTVRDDDASFDNLTDIVKTDPTLRVRMPKIANSSPCGLPKRVESQSQARSPCLYERS
jgi:HD-like signal output (HDOD) protein